MARANGCTSSSCHILTTRGRTETAADPDSQGSALCFEAGSRSGQNPHLVKVKIQKLVRLKIEPHKFAFFRDFKNKITIEPVRFASILLSFNINQFASLRLLDFLQ
jgi:hypothetical protein